MRLSNSTKRRGVACSMARFSVGPTSKKEISMRAVRFRHLCIVAGLLTSAIVCFSAVQAGKSSGAGPVPTAYSIQLLGTLGGTYSLASDMNGFGDVVGYSATASDWQHGFL